MTAAEAAEIARRSEPGATPLMGQSRRFNPLPISSGLPRSTDIARPARWVPREEIRTSDYSAEWWRQLLSSGRRDKRRHWNAQRIHKAGRVIRQFDLALQLLAKRPDQARSKALSGRCTDGGTTFFAPD
jgi:hypothetical protein